LTDGVSGRIFERVNRYRYCWFTGPGAASGASGSETVR